MSTSIQSILALLTTIGITISLGLVLLNILLFIISIRIPAVEFYARLLAAYLSLMLCALYGVFASIFLRLVGYGGIAQWATARSFKYVMGWTIGVYFTVEDPDNILGTTRPAVFIGNHQSELDVLMLGAMFPQYCSVSAKSQLRRMPFLGWFMALSGTVFIDRANSSNAREAMAGAANQITKQNQSVYMFPEGTRSYFTEAGLLPFKKGAFHLAVQAGVPIVPVVVANYADVLDVKGRVFKTGSVPIKGRHSLLCLGF